MKKKSNFTASFKAKVGCAALRENKSTNELSAEHGVHSTQINTWRRVIVENSSILFERKTEKGTKPEADVAELQRLVGEQAMQLAWYKKKLGHIN